MRLARPLIISLALLAPSLVASAQSPTPRAGFYGSFGVAFGAVPSDSFSTQSGAAYYLAGGWTLDQRFRLGLEAQAWSRTQGGGTVNLDFLLASLSWYPSDASDFWVKANVGGTNYKVHLLGEPTTTSSGGVAVGLGVGYDWHPVSGTFVFIPYVAYTAQVSSSSGEPRGKLFQIGLGFGYKH